MRARIYERLMDSQERIARDLYTRGVSHESVLEALDAVDEGMSAEERRDDLYLAALTHFVVALGGRLEVRALFEDTEIVALTRPEDEGTR